MILKIQKTELTPDEEATYWSGWVIFDNVKEIHELPPRHLEKQKNGGIGGRLFTHPKGRDKPTKLSHLLLQFRDGSTQNIYFDVAAYLMNDEGKTIQSYNN